MALFIPGMKCPLCDTPILAADERRSFPPFVRDSADPLYVLHDATVHARCLCRSNLATIVTEIDALRARAQHRICEVCRRPISESSDHYAVGYVSCAVGSPAKRFNYLQFHRSHVRDWEHFDELGSLSDHLASQATWIGPPLVPPQLRPLGGRQSI